MPYDPFELALAVVSLLCAIWVLFFGGAEYFVQRGSARYYSAKIGATLGVLGIIVYLLTGLIMPDGARVWFWHWPR